MLFVARGRLLCYPTATLCRLPPRTCASGLTSICSHFRHIRDCYLSICPISDNKNYKCSNSEGSAADGVSSELYGTGQEKNCPIHIVKLLEQHCAVSTPTFIIILNSSLVYYMSFASLLLRRTGTMATPKPHVSRCLNLVVHI